jgi:uncharacterized phage protein (TIGR02218 family)
MRTVPAGLAARLSGGATTLAHAFIVTRSDGAVFGFTDHDRPLTVAGVACEPGAGLDRSTATSHSGLAVGEEEIAGALTSDRITDADLAAGRWDDAVVTVHLVDWQAPQHRMQIRTGRIGEVVRADGAFRAEIRGPAAALDSITGRRFLATCDAELGDDRCKVALGPLTSSATLTTPEDAGRFRVSGVGGFAAGWFTRGRLSVTDGPLAGSTAVIDAHLVTSGAVTIVLRRPLAAKPAAGTVLALVAGCDKTFRACDRLFDNTVNFRGFPHIPGRDAAFAYARESGHNDGGSLDS